MLNLSREGANRHGRLYAVMYDVAFDRSSVEAIKADWTRLVNEMKLMETPAYLRHRGVPVVSLWGYGFGHRAFDPEAAEELLQFFKKPENGGCTIMLGVPNDWASWTDERMTLLREYTTIISPWNVGRYRSPEAAQSHFRQYWPGDLELCRQQDLDYYAVAFPGFSWTNLQNGNAPLDQIPRLGGRFFWSQMEAIKQYGMNMVYVAMFDEADEGTAIFKCTNQPPVGRFATYEGMPSDHYLRLAGMGGRLLRGEEVSFPDITRSRTADLSSRIAAGVLQRGESLLVRECGPLAELVQGGCHSFPRQTLQRVDSRSLQRKRSGSRAGGLGSVAESE
ncbi:MAG: hypothetical protein VCF24_20455 [Candidatus Latescibacterota bacterium]